MSRTKALIGRGRTVWVLATLALLVALVAALLGQDLRSWRDTLRAGAVGYAASPRAEERWTPSTILPAGISGRLLGAEQNVTRFSALRSFALAHAVNANNDVLTSQQLQLLQQSEVALARVVSDPNPAVAAQAYDLLGILLFTDARDTDPPDVASYLSAVAAMQNAVRADGDSEPARSRSRACCSASRRRTSHASSSLPRATKARIAGRLPVAEREHPRRLREATTERAWSPHVPDADWASRRFSPVLLLPLCALVSVGPGAKGGCENFSVSLRRSGRRGSSLQASSRCRSCSH